MPDWVVIGLVAWGVVALAGGLLIGRCIRTADEREQPPVSTGCEPPDAPAEPAGSVQQL